MKIGELASQAGCDAQTVRYYEREGLLRAPRRETSGYRRYDEQHLRQLHFIRHCRALDIPLAEVRQLLEFAAQPGQSCAQVDGLLDRQIALVSERIRALRLLEQQLLALRRSCDGDPSHGCAILQSFMGAAQEHACACHQPAAALAQA
jgi:Cd(II)/Pb(II)-responsive transcriptional regulator